MSTLYSVQSISICINYCVHGDEYEYGDTLPPSIHLRNRGHNRDLAWSTINNQGYPGFRDIYVLNSLSTDEIRAQFVFVVRFRIQLCAGCSPSFRSLS